MLTSRLPESANIPVFEERFGEFVREGDKRQGFG